MKKKKIYRIIYCLLMVVLILAGLVMVANAEFGLGPIVLACGIILLINLIKNRKNQK